MPGATYVTKQIEGDDDVARSDAFKECRAEARKRLRTDEIELVTETEMGDETRVLATTWRTKDSPATDADE